MTATFGGLQNATLRLEPGLNLLELPNESGKSTWCAFLRAMLYGLESRKGGSLSERNRYTPWSGAAMAGEVELVWQGKEITLRRFPKGSNPFGGFQAVYTGTEETVPGLTADNVGEALLGISKEVFQRTCFIPQGGLWVEQSGDLERRVAALAAAGEEDVSFSDAEGRLRDWRNARQSNRSTGSLPKLRARLSDAQAQRQRLLNARAREAEARSALEALEPQRREVEADLQRHAALEQAGRMADQRQRYEHAAHRLAAAEGVLAQAAEEEDQARRAVPPEPGNGWAGRLALALALLAGCALMVCAFVFSLWPLALGGLSLLNIGALGTHMLNKSRRAAQAAFDKAQEAAAAARSRLETARNDHIAAQAAWKALSAQGEPPASPEISDLPRNDLAQDRQQLARIKNALALYQDQAARAKGEEEALGGLAPMEEAIAALQEEVAREEEELDALNLALDALTAANAQLQTRFSPALNETAGAILSRLTGGKYDSLTFTREFQTLARAEGAPRGAQLLSQGTADQAYLALRLAICLLALPRDDTAPLVLDDALVSFDDHRLKLALELLSKLGRERQILLFTCQSRERLALACISPKEPL